MDFNRIVGGLIRAARLDVSFYEEVEKDTSYSQDALIVVILASLVGAFGKFLGALFTGHFVTAILLFIVTAAVGVGGYFLWVWIAHLIGTRLFKGNGDFGMVQRAFGFAYAPQFLNILSFIPCLGGLIGFVAWIWSIATGFVAIRQSMDLDNTNAALTVIISAVVVFVAVAVVMAIFAAMGLAGAALTGAFSR
jgi:hypothetical protein